MKNLLLLVFVGIFGTVLAESEVKWTPNVHLKSNTIDPTLAENQSKYTFEFLSITGASNQMIYSIDGTQKTVELSLNSFEILTTPGKHIFQFYYSENYFEVYTDSLEVENKFHSVYEIRMERSDIQIMVDKPVIYLYPEEEIEVEIVLDIEGTPTFFYPKYENGWKFNASPTGDLTFGNNTYNYLFWEASQRRSFTQQEMNSGFNVKKSDVTSFLEEKLTQAGLNSKEQADFITYWGPRLTANQLNFVHFEFNEECNHYAKIQIEPKPTSVYRIYITWMAIDKELETEGQEISHYNREGFTVLEWGGSEIKQEQPILN